MIDIIVAIIGSGLLSSGMWAYLSSLRKHNTSSEALLLGIAHYKIVFEGKKFLKRGWLTLDEYEDFMKYLYEPYAQLHGNGLAEKIVGDVKRLPTFQSNEITRRVIENEHPLGPDI